MVGRSQIRLALATLISGLILGCSDGDVSAPLPPLTLEPPSEFHSDGLTWTRSEVLNTADQNCLHEFFRRNNQLAGSPDLQGPPLLFTAGAEKRRFYWISSMVDGFHWRCVRFEDGIFTVSEDTGLPF